MARIRHVVVLMLENRSFDCLLGRLYPRGPGFHGLSGQEGNVWHKPDGSAQLVEVWTNTAMSPATATIPDPDPGELFTDIAMQLYGLDGAIPGAAATMSGFVDNYMRQPAASAAGAKMPDPYAVMHGFTEQQMPVISGLARAFGVSDSWHASAPCQTWPNRFFVHCATAAGYVNNSPPHFPYTMPTIFSRLAAAGADWKLYFHDMPQAATLTELWLQAPTHFRDFGLTFAADAAAGTLPEYSFIEPRYFPDVLLGEMPNDLHPPHNVSYGEQLIAQVYNALRSGPGWKQTLLVITCDEHGGIYDHVPPPAAVSPGGAMPDGFAFDRFGVRVPAVLVSPWIAPGSVIRPPGAVPFDHTSIIATLRRLFAVPHPLTPRDAAAPDLLGALSLPQPDNDGPTTITPAPVRPAPGEVSALAAAAPNFAQRNLSRLATHLPAAGADIPAHIAALADGSFAPVSPVHIDTAQALAHVTGYLSRFLGRI